MLAVPSPLRPFWEAVLLTALSVFDERSTQMTVSAADPLGMSYSKVTEPSCSTLVPKYVIVRIVPVGAGVGTVVGRGVGFGVGRGVGFSVGRGVGADDGRGVGFGVGRGVGFGAGHSQPVQ